MTLPSGCLRVSPVHEASWALVGVLAAPDGASANRGAHARCFAKSTCDGAIARKALRNPRRFRESPRTTDQDRTRPAGGGRPALQDRSPKLGAVGPAVAPRRDEAEC